MGCNQNAGLILRVFVDTDMMISILDPWSHSSSQIGSRVSGTNMRLCSGNATDSLTGRGPAQQQCYNHDLINSLLVSAFHDGIPDTGFEMIEMVSMLD